MGAAMALNLTYISNMVISDIWMSMSQECSLTLVKWDKSALTEWGSYLRVGVPGACMLCFEWWAFEILAIFTGYMGVEALAAEVVIINIVSFIFMMPLGISFAASSLTGNFIGQRNTKLAKRYANLAISFGVFASIFVLIFIITFNDALARLFTNDEAVIDVIKQVLWVVVLYIFFDAIHGV